MMLLLLSLAQDPVRILDVDRAPLREGVPAGWQVRAVRGQAAPTVEIANDGGGAVMRIRGAGRAAWFYRALKPQLTEPDGALHWSWRVLEAPAGADLRSESLDDSPIRVYVVFGKPGFFGKSARIIFYTFGNDEPAQFQRASFGSDKLHVIRMDGSAERQQWREHSVAPFADYRRIWKGTPPPITAVGVMQDTDQTRAQATAEIRRLDWTPGVASPSTERANTGRERFAAR